MNEALDIDPQVSTSLSFFIDCVPPSVTAQQKGAFALRGGGVRFFKKAKAAQAENSLWAMVQPYRPATPIEGPVKVSVQWTWPWRAGDLRTNGQKKKSLEAFTWVPCDKRPDIDNVVKAFLDVLGKARFYNDDGQVAFLSLRKGWGDRPGIGVVITRWTADAAANEAI